MYDIIIKNGMILDGTASPYLRTDIAVKDGKIAKIAKDLDITAAAKVIDASGLTVTPGFIDSHSHADGAVLSYPDMTEKAEQGITTSIGGQCGSSPAPKGVSRNAFISFTSGYLSTYLIKPLPYSSSRTIVHSSSRFAIIDSPTW